MVSGQNGHGIQCPEAQLERPTWGEFQNLQQTIQILQDQRQEDWKRIELLQQSVSIKAKNKKSH